MVPRIASRGGSFQGAGMYYLYDKEADTSERVAWTETLNLPTNDPNKAMNWMAYTAMSADELKRASGVKATGRKAQKGSVYSYSLAWHPDQSPEEQHMKLQAKSTLELLGLQDHEAVVVAHQETDHDHVHVIVNLVHPETGKTAKVYKDHIKLSEWAETYEKDQGHVYCEKRVENNKNRGLDKDDTKKTQHKEEQLKRANIVHDLYMNTEDSEAFRSAMMEQGFELTTGKRRALSFVDQTGKIHSLSRHINLVIDKEQYPKWRKEIKERLSNIDLEEANVISEQKKKEWKDKSETFMEIFKREAQNQYHKELDEKRRNAVIQLHRKHRLSVYETRRNALLDTFNESRSEDDRKALREKIRQLNDQVTISNDNINAELTRFDQNHVELMKAFEDNIPELYEKYQEMMKMQNNQHLQNPERNLDQSHDRSLG